MNMASNGGGVNIVDNSGGAGGSGGSGGNGGGVGTGGNGGDAGSGGNEGDGGSVGNREDVGSGGNKDSSGDRLNIVVIPPINPTLPPGGLVFKNSGKLISSYTPSKILTFGVFLKSSFHFQKVLYFAF